MAGSPLGQTNRWLANLRFRGRGERVPQGILRSDVSRTRVLGKVCRVELVCGNSTMRAMKKVFHFDAPREKYQCDAAIIWCFDNRFDLGFRKFLKRAGVANSDPIKIAGGAKCLASPERESDCEFVLEQIRKSIRLHATRRVILMLHSDCGAYGGLDDGFGGDARAEAEHHHA